MSITSKQLYDLCVQIEIKKNNLDVQSLPLKYKPLFQVLYPHIYGTYKNIENFAFKNQLSKNDIILMYSAGISSTATLWNIINKNREPMLLFIQGTYPEQSEKNRRNSIVKIMTESRADSGKPFTTDYPFKTWLTSFDPPFSLVKLSKSAKMAILLTIVYETVCANSKENKPSIVWGNIHEYKNVFQALDFLELDNICLFKDAESSLFSIAEAEITSNTVLDNHPFDHLEYSCGPVFPRNISSLVCSCWNSTMKTAWQPFQMMCGDCKGCKRYKIAYEKLTTSLPVITIGKEDQLNDPEQLPTFKEEQPRKIEFLENLLKKQAQEKEMDENEEEEQEEPEEEEDDDLEQEEEESLDEELDIIDENLSDDQENTDLPEELDLSDFEDESTHGRKKKKFKLEDDTRKKKKKFI